MSLPRPTVHSPEDLPLSFPSHPAFVLDQAAYAAFPARLAIQYSPATNENPYGILPRFYFAHSHTVGTATSSFVDHTSIKQTLARCSRGDLVCVARSTSTTGYRHTRSTTDAVFSIVGAILRGFNTYENAGRKGNRKKKYYRSQRAGAIFFDFTKSLRSRRPPDPDEET